MTPYADVTFADSYFSNILNADSYENSEDPVKLKALKNATLIIDQLPFKGVKSVSTQERSFPRDVTSGLIPVAIQEACCEIALKLLEDFDMNAEHLDANIISEGYANVRTTRDIEYVAEYLSYGIPCLTAWQRLKPYITENRTVKLVRS